jgi:cyanate permease
MANAAWSHLWFGSAILCLAAMVAVHVLLPQTTSAGAANSANQNTDANVGKTGLALLIAAYGLFGFGYVITATFLVAIVRDTATIAALEPIIWLILGLAAAPSVALWAWSGMRFGILPTYAVACLLEAVGVAASVLWLSAPGVITAAILLGGTFIGLTALGFMAARTFAAGNLRRALAGMTAAFGLGQIIGPALAGYLHDLTGSFVLPSLLAVAALIASAVFVSLLAKH